MFASYAYGKKKFSTEMLITWLQQNLWQNYLFQYGNARKVARGRNFLFWRLRLLHKSDSPRGQIIRSEKSEKGEVDDLRARKEIRKHVHVKDFHFLYGRLFHGQSSGTWWVVLARIIVTSFTRWPGWSLLPVLPYRPCALVNVNCCGWPCFVVPGESRRAWTESFIVLLCFRVRRRRTHW